jgi:uncharacterized cupin superfamily protein
MVAPISIPPAMLCHWDDVPWSAFEHGDVKMQRRRLGAAAGVRDIGLSRYLVAPGCRGMPLHVHADEEEIVFVLAGSGLSWQDDAVHEVRAGDAIVHRPQQEAHTLSAAAETLDVLIFASGSPTGLTQVPRAGITRVGAGWMPPDAPHPLQAEPPAGDPPAPSPRPPTIVALEDVEGARRGHGRVARVRRDLGRAAGSVRCGLVHVTIEPGAYGSPRHCHSVEEELFVVLAGDGEVLLGDDAHAVAPGSVVARPPATGVPHAFVAGDDGLTLLAFGTREPGDLCWYPDSSKVLFRGLGVVGRIETLGYWDGEP